MLRTVVEMLHYPHLKFFVTLQEQTQEILKKKKKKPKQKQKKAPIYTLCQIVLVVY